MTKKQDPQTKPCTLQEQSFCVHYVDNRSAAKAYRFAFKPPADKTANYISKKGNELLNRPHVAAYVARISEELSKKTAFGIKEVLQRWIDIATADPNKIVRVDKDSCRHCHGFDFEYQWTKPEYDMACRMQEAAKKPPPECVGGLGFNPHKKPHPKCPHCFGNGHEVVRIANTSKLTGKEKLLYAGAKNGKNGIEVLLRDQDQALAHIARHLGMFTEKPKDETPPLSLVLNVTDPMEASKIYQKIMLEK